MASYKLVPCVDPQFPVIAGYYVNNHTNPLYDLSQYANGTVLLLTLPTALTGLLWPVTTCVQVYYNYIFPPNINYDLGIVTNFGQAACLTCMNEFVVSSCDNPETFYSISTSNPNLQTFFDNCPTTCNGCQPSLYINLGGTPPATAPPDGCYSLGTAYLEPINIDFYNPEFILTCGINSCYICNATCYKVTPCDGSPSFIITDPVVYGNPSLILDTVTETEVVVTSLDGETDIISISGCMVITQLPNCNPIGEQYPLYNPSTVTYGSPPVTHPNCQDCYPPSGYILRRCDDEAISFTSSTNLSGVVGKVITNIKVLNCNSTFSICSSVRQEQCWKVEYYDEPGEFEIEYLTVLPNCDCCPGPCN